MDYSKLPITSENLKVQDILKGKKLTSLMIKKIIINTEKHWNRHEVSLCPSLVSLFSFLQQ